MSQDTAMIERIVADVLEQLQLRPIAAVAPAVPPVTHPTPAPAPTTFGLTDSVITAAVLEKSPLTSGARLTIAPRSILTPSARDWLKQRNVTVSRGTTGSPVVSTKSASWQLLASSISPTVRSLIDQISRSHPSWRRQLTGNSTETTELAIRMITTGEVQRVLAFSNSAELIACRANRNDKVRAAVIATRDQLLSVESELSPNVVIVNPIAKSLMELRHLVQACAQLSAPRNLTFS